MLQKVLVLSKYFLNLAFAKANPSAAEWTHLCDSVRNEYGLGIFSLSCRVRTPKIPIRPWRTRFISSEKVCGATTFGAPILIRKCVPGGAFKKKTALDIAQCKPLVVPSTARAHLGFSKMERPSNFVIGSQGRSKSSLGKSLISIQSGADVRRSMSCFYFSLSRFFPLARR